MSKYSQNSSQAHLYHVNEDTLANIERYVDFFRLVCLQDITFFNENQYTVACAILSSARMQSKVSPVWSHELVQLSGLQHHHFLNIEQKIMDSFNKALLNDSVNQSSCQRLAQSSARRKKTVPTEGSPSKQSRIDKI